MSAPAWSAYDDGYLRAHEWEQALAGGAPMPQEAAAMQLGPGEVAHARFERMGVSGYFGESKETRSSFLLFGGPVGLAVTGAASIAYNQSKKAEARRAAVPRWHRLGVADVEVTSQRLAATGNGQTASFWFAEIGPLQMAAGNGGIPAVQFQPTGQPVLQLESAWAPILYVFVHHLVDGRPPSVPLPDGLLDRARAAGRLA